MHLRTELTQEIKSLKAQSIRYSNQFTNYVHLRKLQKKMLGNYTGLIEDLEVQKQGSAI